MNGETFVSDPSAMANGAGHNSKAPLTDDERADLQVYYEVKIRTAQKAADEIKAKLDVAREETNFWFKRLSADLKISRKDFVGLLQDKDLSEAEFIKKEATRLQMYRNAGMPVGTQLALDFSTDTVTEAAQARAEGKRAYGAYADPIPPKHVAAILHQEWLAGWHEGQEETAMRMGRAEEVIKRRSEPDPEAPTVDLNAGADEPEPSIAEEKAKERKSVRKAKESLDKLGEASSPEAQRVLEQARADEAEDKANGQFEHAA